MILLLDFFRLLGKLFFGFQYVVIVSKSGLLKTRRVRYRANIPYVRYYGYDALDKDEVRLFPNGEISSTMKYLSGWYPYKLFYYPKLEYKNENN